MFITKKHLSRRTVLKGAGVAISLPLLDAMIPASTALANYCGAIQPRSLRLHTARRGGEVLGAQGDGQGFRVLAHPEADGRRA